jgi:dienelactone hydrolase
MGHFVRQLMKWFPTHGTLVFVVHTFNSEISLPCTKRSTGSEQTRPGLDKTIAYAKSKGATKFAAVGYCFGKLCER